MAALSPSFAEPARVERVGNDWRFVFHAMATPCEIRIESDDLAAANAAMRAGEAEARRIEQKFSRYRQDNIVHRINTADGLPIAVDDETTTMLDFAAACHQVSDGLFDLTSGVLRRVWKFDGSDHLPDDTAVATVRVLVGWEKVSWDGRVIALRPGMEIDFGGLAKEYAVDRCLAAVSARCNDPTLVNFGGDLKVSGPRRGAQAWKVAIEAVDRPDGMAGLLELRDGALATSGDARRYLIKNGVRYGHILDPRSGYPVRDPPRSVTVAAQTCVAAGLSATLAILHGANAEAFLKREGIRSWCIR